MLHERPHVVYSGNTQGRHARETGRKGCLLVTVDVLSSGHELREVEFRETDLVRWFRETIPLQPDDDADALLDAGRDRLREVVAAADGRLAAVRLEFTGRCAVHEQLAKDASRQQLVTNLRALASDFGDVWIEKIKFHTQSPLDLNALRERHDLIGQLLRDIGVLANDPQSLIALTETKDLAAKVAAELTQDDDGSDKFDLDDPARHVGWLRDAEALLLSHLV